MAATYPPDSEMVIGPSGTVYQLASDSMPPLQRAEYNRRIIRTYLLDIIDSVRAKYPQEAFSFQLIDALSRTIRSLPVPWLREYAYAGMIAVLQDITQDDSPIRLDKSK